MKKAFGIEIKEIDLKTEKLEDIRKEINGLFIIGAKEIDEEIVKKLTILLLMMGKYLLQQAQLTTILKIHMA